VHMFGSCLVSWRSQMYGCHNVKFYIHTQKYMVVCTCLAVAWYHEEVKCMVAIMWSFTPLMGNKKFKVMLRFIQEWRFMLWSYRLWHHVTRKVIPYIFKEGFVCSFRMMVMVCFSNILGNHLSDWYTIWYFI
jgi:hypothetical protein